MFIADTLAISADAYAFGWLAIIIVAGLGGYAIGGAIAITALIALGMVAAFIFTSVPPFVLFVGGILLFGVYKTLYPDED